MAKLTLTRILVELKTIDSKITTKLNQIQLLDLSQKKYEGKTLGSKLTITEFAEKQKSEYQAINDLIKRKISLRKALLTANAYTSVTVGGSVMSIQECIDFKNSVLPMKRSLLQKLTSSRQHINVQLETSRIKLDEQVTKMVEANIGKDRKANPEDFDAIAKPFIDANKLEKIDPLDLDKEIEKVTEEIQKFEQEVDVALSEINAKTEVEII